MMYAVCRKWLASFIEIKGMHYIFLALIHLKGVSGLTYRNDSVIP